MLPHDPKCQEHPDWPRESELPTAEDVRGILSKPEPLCLCSPLCGTEMCPIHATPESSVPLSAIRALVQQWDAKIAMLRALISADAGSPGDSKRRRIGEARIKELESCRDELAALCPAPPEDRK